MSKLFTVDEEPAAAAAAAASDQLMSIEEIEKYDIDKQKAQIINNAKGCTDHRQQQLYALDMTIAELAYPKTLMEWARLHEFIRHRMLLGQLHVLIVKSSDDSNQ